MKSFLTRAAALCLAGFVLSAPAHAQQAEPAVPDQANRVLKATHGAWEIHCIEGTETCVMQQVGETADGKRAILVTIQRISGATADGKEVPATLTALAPLGVWIPYNIRFKIDEGELGSTQLIRCVSDGCIGQAPLSAQDVNTFKRGSTAKFGFVLTEEILVDISLNGFTAAYDALTPVAVQAPAQN